MIMVLNLGLKSVRAIIFDERANKVKSSSLAVNTILQGDHVEQDPEEWWSKSLAVMKDVVLERDLRRSITTIVVTSSSSCLVAVDHSGRALGNAIMVSDKRAVSEATQLNKMESFQRLRNAKRNIFSAQPSFMIPKLLWLRRNEPELFARAATFESPNDFLIQKLSGEVVTDPLNAEKFYYDVETGTYPQELYSEIRVQLERLPKVAGIGAYAGSLLESVKSTIGFSATQEIRVTLATYDAICAFLGSGVTEEGEGCDVSGTVSSLRVLSRSKPSRYNDSVFTQYEPTNNIFIIGGSNNLGGGLIEWTKQCFYREEKHAYEIMENEARESMAGAHGILFLPYLLGERTPHWDTNLRGTFFGLDRFHERKDLVRAVFESTAFSIRDIVEAIEHQGVAIRHIRCSGGLSRIPLIAQLKADILGKEIQVLEEFETTSLGAFVVAAIAEGMVTDLREASRHIRIREVVMPNQEKNALYNSFYKLYGEVRESLTDCFRKRKELVDSIYFERLQRIENL